MTLCPPPQERRRFRRQEKLITADLYETAGGVLEQNVSLRDASPRGLGFETTARLIPGHAFRFRLHIPDAGLISGKAVARWTAPSRTGPTVLCGAEITEMRRSHARALRCYLEPSSAERVRWADAALLAAGFLVLGMLWWDFPLRYPHAWAWMLARGYEVLEWLPLGLIVTGGLLGIISIGAIALIALGVYFAFTVFFRRS